MSSRVFLAALLSALPAGADDASKANQLPQEKVERLQADLQAHCRKILQSQIAIRDATARLHMVIEGTPDKKPRPRDRKALLELAAWEKAIVVEVTRALDLLKTDETAIAFAEVFQEVRKDMKRVQGRLSSSDAGPRTQAMQQEIIEMLKEIVAAFRKR